jgi:hypothetical protein
LVLGSDPSGFLYLEDPGGQIGSFDTKGGGYVVRASGLGDFISRLVFGAGAAEFAGPDWADELARAGLLGWRGK